MKSNQLLTYLLYALLLTLISIAGYKACQMKNEKSERERFEADLQQSLKQLGYPTADTTNAGGSSFTGGDTSLSKSRPRVNADGIETDGAASTSTAKTPATTTTAPTSVTKAPSTAAPTTTPAKTIAPAKTTTTTTASTPSPAVETAGKGRYMVVVGTFSKMEGARRRLEEVIKLGYPGAEIGKINNGQFAVVIVKRTNNKAEATKLADVLKTKKQDARVMDMNK